jgi:predicted lipoprotein
VIMLPQFKDATQLDGYFEDDIDAATSLLKTLVEPIEIIRDLKLDRPLGSQFDKAKFKRLESWRSRRSLVNLKLNLQSLELFFMGTTIDSTAEKTERDKGLRALLTDNESIIIENNFKLVKDELHRFKMPLEEAILIKKGYQTAKSLSISLTKLHKSLEEAITHSGIRLGFNSRDGD